MLLAPLFVVFVGVASLVWLVFLSVWLFRLKAHYSRLIDSTGRNNLTEILETLLDKTDHTARGVTQVQEEMGELSKKSQKHIQKVGLVRFNPFGDTGGNQSFALSLLDATDSGAVILSLHGRDGTRVYMKNVKSGKSIHSLSKEEKQAIESAK